MSARDAVQLFAGMIDFLKKDSLDLNSPLEDFVIKTCGKNLAYIDNRKDARQNFGFDFWSNFNADWLRSQGIEKRILYSESQQFPDFLFKVKKSEEKYIGGSLIELKDSKGGTIASFNSTIPTKYKSLEEIDVINGSNLVSRIAKIIDGELAPDEQYFRFDRRCFYLVRTYKGSKKVKVSIVDGSFFETIPKENLFYQMFLNVLREHLKKEKKEGIPKETLEKVEKALSHITDQTIIAGSQNIEGASVKPRLRIMAEVHPEGSPHSHFYPEITHGSFNLILQSSGEVKEMEGELSAKVPEIEVFSIVHKRNGKHTVFQFRKGKKLTQYT